MFEKHNLVATRWEGCQTAMFEVSAPFAVFEALSRRVISSIIWLLGALSLVGVGGEVTDGYTMISMIILTFSDSVGASLGPLGFDLWRTNEFWSAMVVTKTPKPAPGVVATTMRSMRSVQVHVLCCVVLSYTLILPLSTLIFRLCDPKIIQRTDGEHSRKCLDKRIFEQWYFRLTSTLVQGKVQAHFMLSPPDLPVQGSRTSAIDATSERLVGLGLMLLIFLIYYLLCFLICIVWCVDTWEIVS